MTEEPRDPTTGKGRPTPKRSEAQRRRRTTVPKDRKEAARLRRERAREVRTQQRTALVTGDERHLPPRDAGPERRMARDLVDSRFFLGQWVFAVIFFVIIPSFFRNQAAAQAIVNAVGLLVFVAMIVQAVVLGRRIEREVRAKYGDRTPRGITTYAVLRALQPRRLRRPPPRVSRGQRA